MKKILVVDDQIAMLKQLEMLFKMKKYEVVTAVDGAGAITAYEQAHPDVVFLDLGLPDMDGEKVLEQILSKYPNAQIAIISGYTDREAGVLAKGAKKFFGKPFLLADLLQWIEGLTQ